MLTLHISHFLNYCETLNFSKESLQALTSRLKEFNDYIQQYQIHSLQKIKYDHLLEFIADYHHPSNHIKKARVWTLKQFFKFLYLNRIIEQNIAPELPYPKIRKTIPRYLTSNEFNHVLEYFAKNTNTLFGIRNLIITMLLGFLGLRLSAILRLNIEHVDLDSRLLWIMDKGSMKRQIYLPQVVCSFLTIYLNMLELKEGPLFLSKRQKRISERTLQNLFKTAMADLGLEKHLHPHLFRHTAATQLNKVSDPEITQFVLGHACRQNTEVYTHLNPDIYAEYMKIHPYHLL